MAGRTIHLYRRGRRIYRSRLWFFVAVAFVAGLILLVPVMASHSNGGASIAAPAVGPTDTATTLPIVGPHVPWVMVGGMDGVAVPDGGTRYGPTVKDPIHGLFSGYARTPLGALVAAVDLAVRTTVGNWRPSAEQQTTGPGRDAWLALRGTVGNDPPPEGFCQTAGFSFISWTPDNASIDIASACPSGGLQAEVISVAWNNGDWQLVRLADGAITAHIQPLTSMDGYTSWGAQ